MWEWLQDCQLWLLPEMKMFQTRFGNQSALNWACETRRQKNAGEKRVDIHDQQRESSQNPENALQSSHQARVAERNTLRHLPCETLSSSGATSPEDGAMELGSTRFATSYVDTSFDRRSPECE